MEANFVGNFKLNFQAAYILLYFIFLAIVFEREITETIYMVYMVYRENVSSGYFLTPLILLSLSSYPIN